MVMNVNSPNDEGETQVEARADELIHEFHAHLEEVAATYPQHAEKKREIFEAWAIQKIAGLQLCVEHMAEQHNRHVQGHGQS